KDLKPLCDDIYLDSLEPAGSHYEDRIEQKLRNADFVIALISADANRSKWVKVELERADSYNKLQGRPVTIPVRLKYDGPYDLRMTPAPTIVKSPTPARATVPQTASATPIRQAPTDLSSVINELKANGLLQEMQGANGYSRLGGPENMENALKAYRAIFKQQSP